MTDLEMTKLCAEAMGYQHRDDNGQLEILEQRRDRHEWRLYDPLKRDAQAMALVKGFGLWISREDDGSKAVWLVTSNRVLGNYISVMNVTDLNRAIVECVAQMQELS